MFKFLFGLWLIFPFIPALAQTHDAELVYERTDVAIRNGKLYETHTNEIKIFNRDGEKFLRVSIPWSKLLKISKLEGWIKDSNGNIVRKLQKNDITDRSAIASTSLYEDDFVREFTLKHNSYPYSVCYTYQTLQEEFLEIEDWVPVINIKVPTLEAFLNIEVPTDYKIKFKSLLTDSFATDTTGERIKYSWKASYKDIIDPEILSPPLSSFVPRVTVIPLKFTYDQHGSFESWITYGNWYNDLLKGLSDLPPFENGKILELTNGINDTIGKIRKLYNYLQDNTRYINVVIETGGLKPYPAKYVAENKYGDCKALSNYFKSVLQVAGIKSFYTMVKAGDPRNQIDKGFPSQQFNHIIICVPVQKDTIWLDCTSDNPFNYLGTFTQNRDVFLIDQNNSHFVRTPALSPRDVNEIRKVNFHRNIQNQAIAIFNNTCRGDEYETMYYLSHSVNESDKAQIFRNNFVENGFELIDFSFAFPGRDSSKIFVTWSGRSNKVYKVYGNDLVIDILPFSIYRLEDPKKRNLPVQIDYPVFKTDSLEYEIPSGYTVTGDLMNKTITSEFGSYNIKTFKKGNNIEVIKNFLLYPGVYNQEKYGEFYKFISKVIDNEQSNKLLANQKI
jgi:hypothetical protein